MYQVRFHGRGGQGVVSAAEILSVTAFLGNKHAQAFPSFGSERMGAPVQAFCRIDDKAIRLREPIYTPDALIILDASLVRMPEVLVGIEKVKCVLINTRQSIDILQAEQLKKRVSLDHIHTIGATELALEVIGRNVPNVIMLAAFSAITGIIPFERLIHAIEEHFPKNIAGTNKLAAERAFQQFATKSEVVNA